MGKLLDENFCRELSADLEEIQKTLRSCLTEPEKKEEAVEKWCECISDYPQFANYCPYCGKGRPKRQSLEEVVADALLEADGDSMSQAKAAIEAVRKFDKENT